VFSGSYPSDDVEFLLKVIDLDFTSLAEKETLIQSGKSHYSQMLSAEYEPTQHYLDTFYEVFESNKKRFAKDILILANNLNRQKNIVLVSLVRAGTPIGVLLKRTLERRFQKRVMHYSISIIRDKEIDKNALDTIVKNNKDATIIFIDGWTGKGVINTELKKFIAHYNALNNTTVSDKLYVVSDIAGVADYCVTNDDYLIPSSALNSTISGLISRSILNSDYIFEGDYHGCKFYHEYKESDLSVWFVDEIVKIIDEMEIPQEKLIEKNEAYTPKIKDYLLKIQKEYSISSLNYLKPGIAESARVLLRRIPHLILFKDVNNKDIAHLKHLAHEKNVRIVEDTTMPYLALAIIKEEVQ